MKHGPNIFLCHPFARKLRGLFFFFFFFVFTVVIHPIAVVFELGGSKRWLSEKIHFEEMFANNVYTRVCRAKAVWTIGNPISVDTPPTIISLVHERCNGANVYAYGSFPEEVNRAVNLIYANIQPERLKVLHLESHQVVTDSLYSCLSYDLVGPTLFLVKKPRNGLPKRGSAHNYSTRRSFRGWPS